ncbi:PIN domain-containing protein [Patescibacteria group bacterium]|nr:PIN domain-containing protein [Patescibacteria group bacterium]
MVILDSNIWIALLNIDDSNHSKARQLFREIKEKIVLPEYIILETATLLSQKISKKSADDFIKNVIDNKDIEILPSSKEFLEKVIEFYLSKRIEKLSFVDYSLLYLVPKVRVITLDKVLKREIEKLL